MMREVPVRDTDPDPYNNNFNMNHNIQDEDRSSPIAFTVDFGNSPGNNEEKNRKLERFALRSSQRKVMSPSPGGKQQENRGHKGQQEQPEHRAHRGQQGQEHRVRSSSRNRSLDVRPRHSEKICSGKEVMGFTMDKKAIKDDDYANDTFESDSDDNHLGHENVRDKNESNPSETGTYTVDKEDDSPASAQEPPLESLLEETKSSYVEEWATKHAFAATSPCQSMSPDDRKSSCNTSTRSRRMLPRPPASGTEQDTTSPDMSMTQFSPDSEQCSLTPPPGHESEEESSMMIMTHTQHLVDVMEERLKQKSLKKLEAKAGKSLVSRNFSVANQEMINKPAAKSIKANVKNVKSLRTTVEPQQDAMEAWKRRKNYDPMAAAGRKKSSDLTRKHSASSTKSGLLSPTSPNVRDDTSESDSFHRSTSATRPRQSASAPSSAKSRSSESSGYQSRSADSRAEKLRRETRTNSGSTPTSRSTTSTNPLRRLAHTNSSSSIKAQSTSNRSSSSLTSKEAEFQAWKRRKNYDPMKAAGNRPSSSKEATRKVSSSSSRNYSKQQTESVKESPRHKKIIELTSREMTKSLIMEDTCSDSQMQRSNSFHCNAKKNFRLQSEDESEDDYGSGYESSLAESQIRSYPHYYIDDDELILPIQPLQSSHSHVSHRSLYARTRSPQSQISPSKSRSKLEALDTLVISTIHNVSNKLCGSSASVLRQAAQVFPEQDEEQNSTLETVIYLLEDMDLPSSPAKKTSRELSGTLRNLKKIEQALEMMKKLLDSAEIEEH